MDDPRLTHTIDRRRPVAVLINAVLHFIPDEERPYAAIAKLMGAMAPGSYLALTHGTTDFMTTKQTRAFEALSRDIHGPLVPRTREQISAFFDGLRLIAPGLVPTAEWHRPHGNRVTAVQCAGYAGIARKA